MEIRKLKLGELKRVNELYRDYVHTYKEEAVDCYEFAEKWLSKCECCGKIVYWDEPEDRIVWSGKTIKCCEDCQNVIDEEKDYYEMLKMDGGYCE